MIRLRIWAAAALVLSSGGCATTTTKVPYMTYDRLDPAVVGTTRGDSVETVPWVVAAKPVTGISAVRAFDRGGKLAVCGSVVIVGYAPATKAVDAAFAASNAALVMGEKGSATVPYVALKPSFMRRHIVADNPLAVSADTIDFTKYPAHCVVTNTAWKPGYGGTGMLMLPAFP